MFYAWATPIFSCSIISMWTPWKLLSLYLTAPRGFNEGLWESKSWVFVCEAGLGHPGGHYQVPAGPLSLASIEWAGAQPPITQAGCPPLEEIWSALVTSWSNITLSNHHLALCIMLILTKNPSLDRPTKHPSPERSNICFALDDKLQDDSHYWLTRKGRWLGLRCYNPTKPGCHPGWETILSWNCRKCRVAEIRPVDAKIAETPCLSLTDYKTDTFLHFRYQNREERLAHPLLFVLSIPKSFFYQRNGGIL